MTYNFYLVVQGLPKLDLNASDLPNWQLSYDEYGDALDRFNYEVAAGNSPVMLLGYKDFEPPTVLEQA